MPQTLMFQPPEVEKLSVYDAPQVMLGMALEGEWTRAGAKAALFAPERLTPAEREGITQRLKEKAGGSTLGNVVSELVTNPLVWLTFLTSPAGAHALTRLGAGGISKIAPAFTAFVSKEAAPLKSIGAMTPDQILRNTSSATILGFDIPQHVREAEVAFHTTVATPLTRVLHRLEDTNGLRRGTLENLDFTQYSNPKEKEVVKRFSTLLAMKMEGMDSEFTRSIVTKQKVKGRTRLKLVDVPMKRQVEADLGQELTKTLGTDDWTGLVDAYRSKMKESAAKLMGDEAHFYQTGEFRADAAKVVAISRGLRNRALVGSKSFAGGVEWMRQLGLGDMAEQVATGRISYGQFSNFVQGNLHRLVEQEAFYLPRNVREWYHDGRPIPFEQRLTSRIAKAFGTTGRAAARVRPAAEYHPEDLAYMREIVGGRVSPDFQRAEAAAFAKNKEPGQTSFLRSNLAKQVSLHTRDMALSHAMHTLDPSLEALRMNKENAGKWSLLQDVPEHLYNPLLPEKKGASVLNALEDQKDLFPGGRVSNADLLYADYARMHDGYARNTLTHLLIPSVTGNYRVEHKATLAAVLAAKKAINAIADSPIGQGLKRFGPVGERTAAMLKEMGDPDLGLQHLDGTLRGMTEYLYGTHLGLNLGSIALNLTQPLLLANTTLGFPRILKGYWKALGEEVSLAGARAEMLRTTGRVSLSDIERMALHNQHFVYANELGLGVDAFKAVDGITFAQEIGRKRGWLERAATYSMKGFEWAERVNRNTVAHATASLYRDKGFREVVDGYEAAVRSGADDTLRAGWDGFLQDVRTMVRETQFGGGRSSTPVAFSTDDGSLSPMGRVVANPLGRMFLPFMVRSFVGQFSEVPKLAQGVRKWGVTGIVTSSRPAAVAHDFMRMLGLSAIAYEVGKATIGADLERGLGFSAATDVLGAQRAVQGEGPFPVPPIVDIPMQMYRAFVSDDIDLWKQQVARVVPFGGVAAGRLAGILPAGPDSLPVAIQREFVDWKGGQDGMVARYKADGSLVGYEHAASVVLRGVGADLGAFRDTPTVDAYLLKQRDLVTDYRRRAINAMLNGNMEQFGKLKAEFEKRTKLPLTITQQQLQQQMKLREVPRVERMLDRLPADVRPIYAQMAAATQPERFGMDPALVAEGATSGARRTSPPQDGSRQVEGLPGQQQEHTKFASFASFRPPGEK
jgi:hypothetical protein